MSGILRMAKGYVECGSPLQFGCLAQDVEKMERDTNQVNSL